MSDQNRKAVNYTPSESGIGFFDKNDSTTAAV